MDMPRTIVEAGAKLRRGELSCVELTQRYLARISALQPRINAFIAVTAERALAAARGLDDDLRTGRDRGPLHGIPIVHKDCFDVVGTATTAGAALYRDRFPTEDALVVRRLEAAGAITLGKTNMNELAAGTSGCNVHFGDVHNPWNLALSPGGSSSGTAAAIAAGLCLGGTGSDAGGSIRVPAACTGLVGLRPTRGLVPLQGCIPRTRTYDVVGPLAGCVHDCALLLQAMTSAQPAAPRPFDPLSEGDACAAAAARGLQGRRLGIVESFGWEGAAPEVRSCLQACLDALERAGAHLQPVRVDAWTAGPTLNELMDIMLYEFVDLMSDELAGRDDLDHLLGPVVRANLAAGRKVGRSRYERLVGLREDAVRSASAALADVDAIVVPAMTTLPPRLDAPATEFDRARETMLPVSFVGLPAIVLPCGQSASGLPVGIQLVGRERAEPALLALAAAIEHVAGGWKRLPAASGGHSIDGGKD